MSLARKSLFVPLAPARRGDFGARFDHGIYLGCRSFDGQAYIVTPSEVIRCRTVRQLSAQEMGHRIRAQHQRYPRALQTESVLEMSTSVWISLRAEMTEACIRQILTASMIPRRMRLTREMFERFGLTAQC